MELADTQIHFFDKFRDHCSIIFLANFSKIYMFWYLLKNIFQMRPISFLSPKPFRSYKPTKMDQAQTQIPFFDKFRWKHQVSNKKCVPPVRAPAQSRQLGVCLANLDICFNSDFCSAPVTTCGEGRQQSSWGQAGGRRSKSSFSPDPIFATSTFFHPPHICHKCYFSPSSVSTTITIFASLSVTHLSYFTFLFFVFNKSHICSFLGIQLNIVYFILCTIKVWDMLYHVTIHFVHVRLASFPAIMSP